MKLRPVLTASAVGGMIAAATIVPANADNAAPVYEGRLIESTEISPTPEPEESESSDATDEESTADDDATPTESATPEPSESPDEVETPEPADTETSAAPRATEPAAVAPPAAEAPAPELLVASPAIPSAEALNESAASSSNPGRAADTVIPVAQDPATGAAVPITRTPATEVVQPLVAASAARAHAPSSAQNSEVRAGSEPIMGGLGNFPAVDETAEPITRGTREILPEPRQIDTIEVNPGTNSPTRNDGPPAPKVENPPAADDNNRAAPGDEQRAAPGDEDLDSAENPDNEVLAEAGSTSARLALGGVVLLVTGVVLIFWRERTKAAKAPVRKRRRRH